MKTKLNKLGGLLKHLFLFAMGMHWMAWIVVGSARRVLFALVIAGGFCYATSLYPHSPIAILAGLYTVVTGVAIFEWSKDQPQQWRDLLDGKLPDSIPACRA